jgi:hypothetical protein
MDSAQSGTKQGQARLYFLRETRVVFSARRAPIKIDDQEIGRLRNGAYFFVDVLPGKHQISIKNVDTGRFSVEATMEAEKTYYLKVIPRKEFLAAILPVAVVSIPGLLIGTQLIENKGMFALVPIEEAIATKKISKLRQNK